MIVNFLSRKEISEITININANWPQIVVPKIKKMKACEIGDKGRILIGDNIVAVELSNHAIIPHLSQENILRYFPHITVDMGAVKFVCNGADIMRPGIVDFSPFKESSIVIIRDQIHEKALAIGLSKINYSQAINMEKGVILSNLHHVGDLYWEVKKEIKY